LDEVIIATIMRDVLRALEYVHKQGGIHRDIKVTIDVMVSSSSHS
jgi:serine/threonine-protein kinase OSR1/STK39